jgi:GNAT superfamily N-acetyltransferase
MSPCPPRSCTVRRATSADLSGLVTFIGETYGTSASFKHAERLLWQFRDAPWRREASADPAIWIAVDGERVVGTIGVQDAAAWIGGSRIDAGWIVDVMIHPDWRGMGLGHQIHAAIMQERKTLVTLTMAPATRRIAERAGAVTLGPTGQFICPKKLSATTVARFLQAKAEGRGRLTPVIKAFAQSGIGPSTVAFAGRLMSHILARAKPDAVQRNLEIEEIERFPDEMEPFWVDMREQLPAVFDRSTAALNWRFVDCPGLAYRRFLLRRDGRICGYLVTRLGSTEELPVGIVADMLAAPADTEAVDLLLGLAKTVLFPQCEYLEAAASAPFLSVALRRAGFLRTRTMRPTVVCTDCRLREQIAAHGDDWYFTKGDHDWDQIHPI